MQTVEDLERIPGKLPPDCVPEDVDTASCGVFVQHALSNLSVSDVTEDVLWRDLFCITGSVNTVSGASVIPRWRQGYLRRKQRDFIPGDPKVVRAVPGHSWVDVPFTFKAEPTVGMTAECSGSAFLVPHAHSWRIWVLITILEQFSGLANPDIPPERLPSCAHDNSNSVRPYYPVVVVGAGHQGLAVAGRLTALGIDYILVDKAPRPGSVWVDRNYDCVRLHTIREQNHLPLCRLYEEDEPNLLPGANVVRGFERYIKKYSINAHLSTEVVSCRRDEHNNVWVIRLRKTNKLHREYEVKARHVTLGLGAWNTDPYEPDYPGRRDFKGDTLHTAHFKNGKKYEGQKAIIIGSSTSAHDVAVEMLRSKAASVTIVQRSPTMVLRGDWYAAGVAKLYNREIPTEVADRKLAVPWKIQRQMMQEPMMERVKNNPEYFDALERAGFRVDRYKGFLDIAALRAAGYHLDNGACARIFSGEIKIKSDSPIEKFTPKGLLFQDGSELEGEVVVFATGFVRDYLQQIAPLVGEETVQRVGGFFQMGSDGEQVNVMKPAVPGLWLFGGGPPHARWFSRFVVLQIQADLLGKSFSSA